jgi:hypothetical protein
VQPDFAHKQYSTIVSVLVTSSFVLAVLHNDDSSQQIKELCSVCSVTLSDVMLCVIASMHTQADHVAAEITRRLQ